MTRFRSRRPEEGIPVAWTTELAGYHLLDPNSHPIPVQTSRGSPNLSAAARDWLAALGVPILDTTDVASLVWIHVLAISYAPAWLAENGDAIRQGWPRVPLPDNAALLRASAALGGRTASLLNPDIPVPGVTAGTLDNALGSIGVPTKRGGKSMSESDRELTAGWGHAGKDGAVMPGRGQHALREYGPDEAAAAAEAELLGARTYDIFLNADAFWRNIPDAVWNFTIGGYQGTQEMAFLP